MTDGRKHQRLAAWMHHGRGVHRPAIASDGGRSGYDLPAARPTAWSVAVASYCTSVAAVALILSNPAHALVVATTPDTTVDPASYGPGWTQGDPGWDNVTESGSNFVYLGDSWVLSARHVGSPSTFTFSTGEFGAIPGQNFVVQNPPPELANGLQLTAQSDLRLIRINGDPGLPSLTIASQSPSVAGTNGTQVVLIGQGRDYEESETFWNSAWNEVASCSGNPPNCYRGFKTISGTRTKRWGTNRLANPNDATFSQAFSHILSNTTTTAVLSLNGRDVITLLSKFVRPGQSGSTAFEAQAAANDSGGAVFLQNGGQWELVGILNAVLNFDSQAGGSTTAIYGNATTFSNLWYYNQDYTGSISDIMSPNGQSRPYSIIGDLTLDGQITEADVTAFQAGWGFDNGLGVGDITSWVMGDLNLDGRVDVDDFLLMREALNGTPFGAGTALDSLLALSVATVPEPASLVLLMLGAAVCFPRVRRQRWETRTIVS